MYEVMINVRQMRDDEATIGFGLAIARQQQAFATGLHVVAEHPTVATIPEAIELMEAEVASARQRDSWWMERCRKASVDGAWDVLRGMYVPLLAARARMADVLVDSLPDGYPRVPVGMDEVTRTLFAGRTPMLLVPQACTQAAAPQCVLVAWNGSGESMQAIRAALPLLRKASQVHLLDGQRERSHDFEPPHLPLRAWLSRQGVAIYERSRFCPGDSEVGQRLLAEADAVQAELLVMGAWGRSRLTELVLGGTTRHVLTHARMPLLMAH